MRVTDDEEADPAYVYLTDERLDGVPGDRPEGMQAFVVLEWKDGRIVGPEVLDGSKL